MRRVFSFMATTALFWGGLYALFIHVAYSDIIWAMALVASGSMAGLGVCLLWQDVIGPRIRGMWIRKCMRIQGERS